MLATHQMYLKAYCGIACSRKMQKEPPCLLHESSFIMTYKTYLIFQLPKPTFLLPLTTRYSADILSP